MAEITEPLVATIKDNQKTQGKDPTKPQKEIRVLNPKQKRVCKCSACGQFLFEIVTPFALVVTRCRRTECKMVNTVTIEEGTVSYSLSEKEPAVRY